MIPIGGIQIVHSVPASVNTPLAQQGALQAARMSLQKSISEDSITTEAHLTSFSERGGHGAVVGETVRDSVSPLRSSQEKEGGGGVRQEQEEGIQTCTKAIASLYIDSKEFAERGGGGGRVDDGKDGSRAPSSSSSPSALSSDSHQHHSPSPHPSPSPPQGPGIQHFSSLELRPPHSSVPASPHSPSSSSSPYPPSPGSDSLQPPMASKLLKMERDREAESTKRSKDVS